MFKIKATHKDRITVEIIDTAESLDAAQKMAFEYMLAYGPKWLVYIEESN